MGLAVVKGKKLESGGKLESRKKKGPRKEIQSSLAKYGISKVRNSHKVKNSKMGGGKGTGEKKEKKT